LTLRHKCCVVTLHNVLTRRHYSCVFLIFWPAVDFVFKPSVSFRHPRKVLNVVPGDFTHTGKLDLLVMSESTTRNQMDMAIYPALVSGGFGEHPPKIITTLNQHETLDFINPISVPTSTLSQPISIDVDGDMKIDLLGITPASSGDSLSPLQVWKNVWNVSYPQSPLFNMCVLSRALLCRCIH
jgi:integrin alpha FG-GAP repeat containing protein 1